ncbi:MAG TPA: FAD-dependent oxidoreductase [Patescibacteria group bacterium]|nr:FAD-dependent oxidoreductase [Patescibacteria group bacterium]
MDKVNRRTFLKEMGVVTTTAVLAAGGGAGRVLAAELDDRPVSEPAAEFAATGERYDVIVVGGGVSGAVAGIASARQGARTLIVEKMGFLGGMLTAGGVGPMMTFHAGERQVVRGIAGEVVERLKAMGGSPGHIVDTTGYTYTVTPFDAELLKHVLETMFCEAGGVLLYHSMLAGVRREGDRIAAIRVLTKSGEQEFTAHTFVDASGDGDLAARSGVDFQLGRESDNLCQPVTMNMKMRQVNIARVKECVRRDPADFLEVNVALLDKATRLSLGGFVKEFEQGRRDGELSFSRECVLFFETNNPGEVIVNTTRIQKVNPTDAAELSRAETEGRRQALELYRFMQKRLPGFEAAVLVSTGPNLGVRESRKIKGRYILQAQDLLDRVAFDDEIACGGYPIDVHSPDGEGTQTKKLPYGAVYGIPYRSLLAREITNLITVGRCISATSEACAAVRVSPIAMAIGQAGGTAGAMAVLSSCQPTELPAGELRQALRKQGAYLR